MSYPEAHRGKCKICRGGRAKDIDYSRYYLEKSYPEIIKYYSRHLENLNQTNLSNHFSKTPEETKAFFMWLKTRDDHEVIGLLHLHYEPIEFRKNWDSTSKQHYLDAYQEYVNYGRRQS